MDLTVELKILKVIISVISFNFNKFMNYSFFYKNIRLVNDGVLFRTIH